MVKIQGLGQICNIKILILFNIKQKKNWNVIIDVMFCKKRYLVISDSLSIYYRVSFWNKPGRAGKERDGLIHGNFPNIPQSVRERIRFRICRMINGNWQSLRKQDTRFPLKGLRAKFLLNGFHQRNKFKKYLYVTFILL